MTVTIVPLAAWMRKTRFRPLPAPIFPDGEPSPDDVELALALFQELDPESKLWYGGERFVERLQRRLRDA
jgi:hypothetical protein